MSGLTFEEPDLARFPCLRIAQEVASEDNTLPSVLNAANEVIVEALDPSGVIMLAGDGKGSFLTIVRGESMDTAWSALIIDDDPGIRQSIRLCLESDNARVLGVGTASGGMEALDRGHFDVVFLDLWLHSESGLAVLPEIMRRQPGVGIIVITAFGNLETAVKAMEGGAFDYLVKPFDLDQATAVVKRALERVPPRESVSSSASRSGGVNTAMNAEAAAIVARSRWAGVVVVPVAAAIGRESRWSSRVVIRCSSKVRDDGPPGPSPRERVVVGRPVSGSARSDRVQLDEGSRRTLRPGLIAASVARV